MAVVEDDDAMTRERPRDDGDGGCRRTVGQHHVRIEGAQDRDEPARAGQHPSRPASEPVHGGAEPIGGGDEAEDPVVLRLPGVTGCRG
ncbi:hypothetical protein ACI796_22665 [Geodermatophilus sp. SYSU D00525]